MVYAALWERDGVLAERFRLGSSQPEPRAWRRKHIADGPEGAASRGASKAKVDPPKVGASVVYSQANKNAGGPRTTRAFRWKEIF